MSASQLPQGANPLIDTGPWTAYTPSNVNITVGNGTQVAAYRRTGQEIEFRYALTFGSSTSFGGTIQVGLPVASFGALQTVSVTFLDLSVDFFSGSAAVAWDSGSTCRPCCSTGSVNATRPFTWTTGDVLMVGGTYQAA